MLSFCYFADIRRTLYDPEYRDLLGDMYEAGIRRLWMFWYNSGTYYATEEEGRLAREYLESRGFSVGGCVCAVGHPGESLNPGGDESDNHLPEGWQYRIGKDGQPVYFCGCINEAMTRDALKALESLQRMGITQVFFDDDLRVENFSYHTGGCFCDSCMAEFARRGYPMTREELVKKLDHDPEITRAWQQMGCDRVFEFVRRMVETGMHIGIMLMPMGDERHGLDATRLSSAFPELMIRVGEFHYDDASFEGDPGHEEQISYIRKHMHLLSRPENAFSETTAFPVDALSPENLIEKIRLEIREGLRNIYLMSGIQTFDRSYFVALKNALPELNALAEACDRAASQASI